MSVPMRIPKWPHIGHFGFDMHMATVPPPPPPTPPMPSHVWAHLDVHPAPSLVTGKWTLGRISTDFLAHTLLGHDWGFLQTHTAMPPYTPSPSTITTKIGSSCKYFLPSYAVQEVATGGVLARAGPVGTAVAVCLPAFLIVAQDCQDVGGVSFVAPTGISTSLVTSHWVGFSGSDLLAGLVYMAGDALTAALISKMGTIVGGKNYFGAIFSAIETAIANFAYYTGTVSKGESSMGTGVAGGLLLGFFGSPWMWPSALGLAATGIGDSIGGSERADDRDTAFGPAPQAPASGGGTGGGPGDGGTPGSSAGGTDSPDSNPWCEPGGEDPAPGS